MAVALLCRLDARDRIGMRHVAGLAALEGIEIGAPFRRTALASRSQVSYRDSMNPALLPESWDDAANCWIRLGSRCPAGIENGIRGARTHEPRIIRK